jgi:hypothetical protein
MDDRFAMMMDEYISTFLSSSLVLDFASNLKGTKFPVLYPPTAEGPASFLFPGINYVVFKYSRIIKATVAPSPAALATCLVLWSRTSPAAKMPGTLVSNK